MRSRFRLAIAWTTGIACALAALGGTVLAQQKPFVDPNVNMVRGITFPDGDPYMQRQNEPSIAVSTRNPCHLVAGANDYRSVDIPFDDTIPPNTENNLSLAGDAWLGLFKSFDCGAKWVSTLLPGYPQDLSNLLPELRGHAAGADPTVRAGTNGLFYYSGMVFNRGSQGTSKIFVARLIDNNNKERGDSIELDGATIVDTGTKGQFLDKPWMVVDVPRSGYGPGSTLGGGATCTVKGQTLPAGNVYMAWAKFTGSGNQHSKLMFAKSTDCGRTFKQHPISNNQSLSQGANLAVAPHDGTLYLTWREFAGNGSANTVNFWIVTSSDGGESWTAAKKIGTDITAFDQPRTTSTFRSNALPAITADHQNRAYVAWSARGSATYYDANVMRSSNDARIMMVVSNDRGANWSSPFPIDPVPARGHQLMPSLTFAAGRIQAIWYDAREDVSRVFGQNIDESQTTTLLHTIDVRGAQATPAAQPVFVATNELSQEISKYRKWNLEIKAPDGTVIGYESKEIGSNPPNLPMYANGTTPFIGDYIDVSGLPSFPVQTTSGQVWQPNIGPLNLMGGAAANLSTSGFPTLASFHATWTDNRDVNVSQCLANPGGQMVGQRNANIYTARLTQGLYVGSPGNTKPLGNRLNPKTNQMELIQRGFVVFAQNTTDTLKFYRFKIETQPPGGRASLKQFDHNGPLTEVIVSVPAASTVARTVYATSTDVNAQLLINIEQMDHDAGTIVVENGQSKKVFVWFPVQGGLHGSVLLNPDRTNPAIQEPDVLGDVPEIASQEVHNPSMFDAQFFKRKATSNKLDVLNAKTPDPENPDPENPDPENPDPENNAQTPDPENPDPENPDPENPDPENPDPENPDPENSSLINSTISDEDLRNATITDIQWKVHNSGNTTSAYKFRPSLPKTSTDQRFQLIVTRRSMALALGADCTPSWKSTNQVLSNIVNFQPKTPDPENPDPENPDPENPDPENPDPENPDPENPDPENANFFLAPEETATVTLRVFDLDKGNDNVQGPPTKREDVAAKTAAEAANTGETTVATAVAGPDLTLFDTPATASPAISRPGKQVTVTFTLSNRGTGSAVAASPAQIRTRVYFSADPILDEEDTLVATVVEPSPFVHCEDPNDPVNALACSTTSSVNITAPALPGTSYAIVITDEDGVVFEADELNNRVAVPIVVANYQLSFAQQPSATTQDFTMTPAVIVAVTHPDGGSVNAADVPGVTLAIANNPSAGTLTGTLFQPNSGVINANTAFANLRINNAGNGYTLSASAPFSIGATSAAFNIQTDLPPVTAADNYTTNEEQALNVAAPGALGNDSDPPTVGIKPASYVFDVVPQAEPTNGNVAVSANGSFVYTPLANFAGTDSFTYRARDGREGNETTGTVTITVTNVNDAPSFAAGSNQTVPEDSGLRTVPGWASEISAGPANESGQAIDFIVTNNNNALFSSQPAVSANGTLTYTSASNANGVATVTVRAHDNGGTANGGIDTSAPQTFTITIDGANDAPVAAPDSYSINEDGTFSIDAGDPVNGHYLNGLLANDTDNDGNLLVVEYLTTTSNGTLLPHQNGSFSYTPNANFFGTDSFTYRAFDGETTGNTVTVTITVNSVNDVPSFTKGANQFVPMNSAPQTMTNWATSISTGAANEAGQALNFIVSNDNAIIFTTEPAIAANGTLTFTPRQNRTGTANVTVQLHDNGGIANGGVDTSAAQTFQVTITSAASTFVVTNTADSGAGSLRQAIIGANANGSLDNIVFNIPGAGVQTITPLTALPQIVFPVTINATTQPGFAGTPLIELNGATAGEGANGFSIASNAITVRGFVINRFLGAGISVNGTDNVIAGNYIGTNAAGTQALGNATGILVSGASTVVIGGLVSGSGNVISGNTGFGIHVSGPLAPLTPGTVVQGNIIGLDATGATALGNAGAGIKTTVAAVQVGGTSAAARNIISANPQGVAFSNSGSTYTSFVIGNYFGTDITGMLARGNTTGVLVASAPGTRVGGDQAGAGNLFAGNSIGVTIDAISHPVIDGLYNSVVQGNVFGRNAGGAALPNGRGIAISNSNNLIGGTTAGAANVIANSTLTGVYVSPAGTGNWILRNSIANNGGLGIDLGNDGLSANDAGDADIGANNLQNFPVITSAFANGGSTTILGTFASVANSAYTIEFFSSSSADPSGYGEGQTYLGSTNVATDASGNAGIATTFNGAGAGAFITATATDAAGNTSEFSQARVVVVNNPPTATNDTILTADVFPMTTTPAANDVDPDVASPSVRTTYRPIAGPNPALQSPGDVGLVTSTGLAYFTGGNQSAATSGSIGILNTATNAIVGTIPLPGNFAAAFAKVDQSTKIVYLRGGINLLAVDGDPASPTYNQLILNINLGTIQSWALDEVHHRLYLTTSTAISNTALANGRLTVIDTDRSSGMFNQVIAEATVPGVNSTATAIGVNAVTNKIYVGVTGGAGLYVADAATLTMTQIFNSGVAGTITSIAINDADNLIYAAGQTTLHAIDGTTDTRVAQIGLASSASNGSLDSRVLIHRGSGRVYVRIAGFPNPSNLVVVDGKRGSATINTILTTINLGRENGTATMAIDEGANRLIVTSASDLRSHIIDTTTDAIVGTIMATQSLGRVSLDPTTHRAYLTGGLSYIKIVNVATAALVTDVHVATEVFGIAVDPVTHSAYVSETGLTTAVKRLNETGISGVIALPHGDGREEYAIRNSATNKIYVLNGGATAAGGSEALPGFVHVIDGNTNTVTASVPVGANPFGLAVDEVNNRIYAGNGSQGSSFPTGISIIDGVTNAVTPADLSAIPLLVPTSLISVGRDMVVTTSGRLYFRVTGGAATQMLGMLNGTVGSPVNLGNVNINIIKYNPATNRLYVGASPVGGGNNQVFVIDAATNAVVTTLTVGSPTTFITNQSYIAVNSATGRVFISDFEEDQVVVLDANTHAVVATLPMHFGPSTVAVDQVHNRAYVGNAYSRNLVIIDGASLRVVRALALPIAPVFLAVDSSISPARIYAESTANEGAISVIDDPGTAAPQITTVTQGAHGAVVLNADGSVTYTATSGYVGADSFTYTTTDGNGGTTTGTANVTVYAPLSIQPATLASGMVGQNYSQTLTRTGGSGSPVVWTVSGLLPGGLHLTTTGLLSGTPQQSGTFNFTVNARDTGQGLLSESRNYSIVVGPPVITPTGLASATINTPYSFQLFTGGATGAVTWSVNTAGNPALSWLSISNTGVLSGTPTTYGTSPSFTVNATDSAAVPQTASRSYTVFVGGPLTMGDLREGVVLETQPSVAFLGGNGRGGLTITDGSLPPGIVLGTGGVFTGTPTRHGTYNFSLELKDCQTNSCGSGIVQQTVNKNIAWRVSAKDQQGSSFTGGPSLVMGGSPNRKLAQVFTVGAHGQLTAVGLSGLTCPIAQTTVTVDIQRLTDTGLPDGTTIATGSAQTNPNAIAVSPAVPVAIGERLAFIASVGGPLTCSFPNSAPNVDQYNAGDAYVRTNGAWSKLADADLDSNGTADGIYDIPSFRTLVMPAMDVTYMPASHGGTTVTLLNNGKVLIAGHSTNQNAEIYDPATGLTTATGQMSMVRQNATATLLGDGTVLIAGGREANGNKNAQAEIFDPNANDGIGAFTPTNGNMFNARDNHRAVRFVYAGVEKVLITGGTNPSGSNLAAPEIYDPVTRTFSVIANNLTGRQSHIAVLLNTGRILLAGGYANSGVQAELFNPATNTFTVTGNIVNGSTGNMIVNNRGIAAAAVLSDGRVLITGGQSGDIRNEAEIYNPATGQFTAVGNMSTPRYGHTATVLTDGSVLIAGGDANQSMSNYTPPLASMERFDPGSGTFVAAGSMETRRAFHAAARLDNGKVLLVGGFSQSWMTANTGELYDETTTPAFTPTTLSNATPGTGYSVSFTGIGGSGPAYTFAHVAGQLPPGLALVGNTLSGTPTTVGLYGFAISVRDSANHSITQTLTLIVGSVNTITSPYRLPDAPMGANYTYQLNATGPGNTWTVLPTTSTSSITNPLPTGITLTAGGLLQGPPTFTGYYNFGVRAIDALGVEAIKVLSINVPSPLIITTTSLGNPELFSSIGCVSTSNGVGTKTYSIASGALPLGITFNGTTTSSCISFGGQIKQTGTFTFRVHITDQSFIPQTVERDFTINVYAADQQTFSGGVGNFPNFGAGTGVRLAERAITGITGTLRGIRTTGLTCAANGTSVGVEIQGLDAGGKPNGQVLATGTGVSPLGSIYLNAGVFFTADEPFAIVFDAAATCTMRPSTFDSYPGDGFISQGGGAWTRVNDYDNTRYDVPFISLVEPIPGLIAMNAYRGRFTATALDNGRVLLVGGDCCNALTAGELFNPADNTTSSTTNLTASRQNHTATKLLNGRVLIAGGDNSSGTRLSTAEIYDPNTNSFTPTGALNFARDAHQATLLLDGKVLITGGLSGSNSNLNSAEIYDPAIGTFTTLPATMAFARRNHSATRLVSGKVLIAAGFGAGSLAEFYDPATQTFTSAPNLNGIRGGHTATLLDDGKVLIAAGHGGPAGEALATAELYDPAIGPNGAFVVTSSMTTPRFEHAAVKLGDGSVLIVGGYTDDTCCYPHPPTAVLERYVPGTGFVNAGSTIAARYAHTVALMGGNKVLITGTFGWSSAAGRTSEIVNAAALPPYLQVAQTSSASGAPLNFTLTPAGGSGAGYTMTLMSGSLPNGVQLNLANGQLTGTPDQSGTFRLTIRIVDGAGRTSYQIFTLKIDPITIGTLSLPTAFQGVSYNGELQATGIGAITWSLVSSNTLPQGLTLNANAGTITGTPTVSCCNYSFTVRATDSLGQTAQRTLMISVQMPLNIGTNSLSDGIAGQNYYYNLFANGGTPGYNWSITGGPIGLAINPLTGQFLNNYPVDVLRQAGSYTIAAHVTDSSAPQQSASKNLPLNVYAQDQGIGGFFGIADINVNAGRKIAQVFRTGTPYGVSGVQIWNLHCDAGVVLTGSVYPVTEGGVPNDSGAPLSTGMLTSDVNGFFNTSNLMFSPPVSMNRAAMFSIVFSTSGHCVVKDWSNQDYYQWGDGFVDDGSGWSLASSTIGVQREDLPITTLITPAASLRFLAGWRGGSAAAKLNDGRVFLAGSDNRTEIYDPSNNSVTLSADMIHARQEATATLLNSGKVLVAGGNYWNGSATVTAATTQLFNPATGQFEASQNMSHGRQKHTATRLANGNVLITGGQSFNGDTWDNQQSADLFDGNGNFIASLNMTMARVEHTATLLNDGRVLIVGGWTNGGPGSVAEIYNPAAGPNGSFSASAAGLLAWPSQHTATLLTTGPRAGQVLIAGGWGYPTPAGSYFYNPVNDTFSSAPTMLTPRMDHTATTLPNGRIVFVGGVVDPSIWLSTSLVEIYDPATGEQANIGNLIAERNTQSAEVVSTPNGLKLAVAAGYGLSNLTGLTIELFDLVGWVP